MAEREQKKRTTTTREDEAVEEAAPASTEKADKIKLGVKLCLSRK